MTPGGKVTTYDGRLELTWTNKHLRLLAHDGGAYEWVPPADHRVAEVRLLRDAVTVGQVHPARDRAKDNLLIHGDALAALTSLNELPEFAREYVGRVKLAYLDPPFNTQQSFLQYDDALEHSVWLTMLRDRLAQVKTLLSPDGSVWVHCDDSEQHRLRCVMDEVFGFGAFVATIVWQKRTSRENRAAFSPSQDYIHVYALSGPSHWKDTRNRLSDESGGYSNPDEDPRGPWRSIPMSAQAGHATASQFYEIATPAGAVHSPPRGRCWSVARPRFEQLRAEGRVYFPDKGRGKPRLKRYPWEEEGLVPFTLWRADEVGTTEEATKAILNLFPSTEPFDTAKPERLLQRIVHVASDPGDIVLDCFLGSGTTAAVAYKMGRRWVGVERSAGTVDAYDLPRLTKVVHGEDPGGVTEAVGWEGGGGFRLLDLAPSMFEATPDGVFLSEWATNGELAEAVAAQLGFDFAPEPPFAGRLGRTRLAVIDGLVNEPVVRLLVAVLPPDERLTVCGTAVDPVGRDLLRALRPGSTARKIPHSILKGYRQPSRTAAATSPEPDSSGADGAADEPMEEAVAVAIAPAAEEVSS